MVLDLFSLLAPPADLVALKRKFRKIWGAKGRSHRNISIGASDLEVLYAEKGQEPPVEYALSTALS